MPTRAIEPPSTEPRARLVEAAIEQIEQHGLANLTVRDVAAAASANIAAVNYHFGSKDALVHAALEVAMRHTLEDIEDILESVARDPKLGFQELLEYLISGSLRFPRLSKALLHDAFSSDDYTGPFPIQFAPMMARIRDALQRAVPGLTPTAAARRTVAALSAVFFPTFFVGLFRDLCSLQSERDRREYAAELTRQMLAPVAKVTAKGRKRR